MIKTDHLPKKNCKVFIDNNPFSFEVKGEFFNEKGDVLYQSSNSLLEELPWEENGFKVVQAFNNSTLKKLKNAIRKNICLGAKQIGIAIDEDNFDLKDYHKYILTQEQHLAIIQHTKNLRNGDFDIDIESLADSFSQYVNFPLTSHIEELGRSHIQIRISRPQSLDINPPHRDGYLSYWKNILNIWIPVAGCNDQSSLPIIPKSHLIPESDIIRTSEKGAYINGNLYYVPCMLKTKSEYFKMIRPNPREGEALIFTPFLIHGAAVNQNKDTTRISLELRFDKKK